MVEYCKKKRDTKNFSQCVRELQLKTVNQMTNSVTSLHSCYQNAGDIYRSTNQYMDPFSDTNIKIYKGMILFIETILRCISDSPGGPCTSNINMLDLIISYKNVNDVRENDPIYRIFWSNTKIDATAGYRNSSFKATMCTLQNTLIPLKVSDVEDIDENEDICNDYEDYEEYDNYEEEDYYEEEGYYDEVIYPDEVDYENEMDYWTECEYIDTDIQQNVEDDYTEYNTTYNNNDTMDINTIPHSPRITVWHIPTPEKQPIDPYSRINTDFFWGVTNLIHELLCFVNDKNISDEEMIQLLISYETESDVRDSDPIYNTLLECM